MKKTMPIPSDNEGEIAHDTHWRVEQPEPFLELHTRGRREPYRNDVDEPERADLVSRILTAHGC